MVNKEQKKDTFAFNRYYFITYIFTDKITEEEGVKILENIFNKSLCTVEEIKKCGIKKLNYKIKKHDYGIYYTMCIKVQEDDSLNVKMNEINRLIRNEKALLRSLICRTQESSMPMLPDTIPHLKAHFDKYAEMYRANKN